MKKNKILLLFVFILLALTGCRKEEKPQNIETETEEVITGENRTEDSTAEVSSVQENSIVEPVIEEVNWETYFDGLNGAAVFYQPKENSYQIYNPELANERRSPCSTFKIISSLMGLKEEVIKDDGSVRTWSGEIFWNKDWNKDMDFQQAFRSSCVWYYREVMNEIEPNIVQQELDTLSYGNCDISDWKGEENNNNPALKGFWIESSLKISPKEQTETLAKIFEEKGKYSDEIITSLKKVMLWEEQSQNDIKIYGKTGLGKVEGVTVDSWYVGFFEKAGKNTYFAIYLGETEGKEVSSKIAREIAGKIILNE